MKDKVQIKVKGHLDRHWEEHFQGLSFSYKDDITILSGSLMDDAQLHGVLNAIRDLNLKLISVNSYESLEE